MESTLIQRTCAHTPRAATSAADFERHRHVLERLHGLTTREAVAQRAQLLQEFARHAASGGVHQTESLTLLARTLAVRGVRDMRCRHAGPAAQRAFLGPLPRLRILAALLEPDALAVLRPHHGAVVALASSQLLDGVLLPDHAMRLACRLAACLPRLATASFALDTLRQVTRQHGRLGNARAFELTGPVLAELARALPLLLCRDARRAALALLLMRLDLARRHVAATPSVRLEHHLGMVDGHLRAWQFLAETLPVLDPADAAHAVSRLYRQFDDTALAEPAYQARLDMMYFWRAERWASLLAQLPQDVRRTRVAARVAQRLACARHRGERPTKQQTAAAAAIEALAAGDPGATQACTPRLEPVRAQR